MRSLSLLAALLGSSLFITAANAAPFAKIYQIDKAYKVIVISGQIQDKLSTGDKVWVRTKSGPVQLVVTMPMMSVAKCRIPPNNDQSDFAQLSVGLEVFLGDAPGRTEPSSSSVDASALTGEWAETFGSGSAALSYSDIYDIDLSSSSPVRLRGADPSLVRNVRYENGRLSFVQHTSFDVSYSLKPSADGTVLEGTAQTPDGARPVRWTKSTGSRTSASGLSGIEGRWMEFWAPGQETDVNYHDIYVISVSGGLDVRLEKEAGGFSDMKFENGWLSFTQKTAFDVRYRLKLSADGSKLEGTAITPKKTVPIRWERQGDNQESASGAAQLEGRWMEFWAPGQETDVTYHDIYLISASGGLSVRLEKEEGGLSDVKFENGWFSFTQKTAFDVRYRLKLSADGSKLEGTATTPSKTVPIRWERQ